MKEGAKEKLTIYAIGFVFLACGVVALQFERGEMWRSILLAVAFSGLIYIAIRQSVKHLKKK